MDEFEISRIIYDYIKEICHYSQMQVFSTSSYQKKYFQRQIDDTAGELINLFLMNRSYTAGELKKQRAAEPAAAGQQFVRQPLQRSPELQQNQQSQEQGLNQVPAGQPAEQELQGITREELAYYDGMNGRPAYVAINGIVYDMSDAARWAGGIHFGLHAGQDLSEAFMGCHRGMTELLEQYPRAGILL